MGIFNFSRKKRTVGQTDSKTTIAMTPDLTLGLLQALMGGEAIDRKKAMNIPKVAKSVHLLADIVSMLPINLYKQENEKAVELKEDVRVKLLNDETGDTLDGVQFKKAIVTDYLLDGNAYVYINRNRNEVKSLHYVEDNRVSILKNVDPIFKDYDIVVNGVQYLPFNFINITRGSRDGIVGNGILQENSELLQIAYEMLLYEKLLVKGGGNKKGFLTSENKLSDEAMEKLKMAWDKLYSDNTQKVVVLNKGLTFQEASQTSVEMQMDEKKRTLDEQIIDLFNITPTDFEKTIKEAVIPICNAIEYALNKSLLLEEEKGSFYFAFDTTEILRGSIKERYEAYQIAINSGFMTKNEARYKEDLERIEGLDVITMGLADVIFDVETKKYFTPNTKLVQSLEVEGGEGIGSKD